jgi:tetratricopeptide (TPR) repeat protein
MSLVCAFQDRVDLALLHVDRALALNPNNALAASNRAQWLAFSGAYAEAMIELDSLIKRDPFPPGWYWDTTGSTLFQLRRYQQAVEAYSRVTDRQSWQLAYIAASLAYLERMDEARQQVHMLLADHPGMTIANVLKIERWQTEDARNHLVAGLRTAGLPE